MKHFDLKQVDTARLTIRPVQLGDEFEMNKRIHNSLENLQQWMFWADDPSLTVTQTHIQKAVFTRLSRIIADYPMVIIHKADKKIIGATGYNDLSEPNKGIYEIGYWLDIDYQGQGYMSETANALTRFAFHGLQAKKVRICMRTENEKSIAIAKRLNFTYNGTKPSETRDHGEDYIYTCDDISSLPPLNVQWSEETVSPCIPKIAAWAQSVLNLDDKYFNQSNALLITPWSTVFEINTGEEPVYLKQTPKNLFLEPSIIDTLRNDCGLTKIPDVIAINPGYHCFLMKKCGDMTLRDHFNGTLNPKLLADGIKTYKCLQKATIGHVDKFLALGVPDWRLDKFPGLYDKLIGDTDFLTDNNVSQQQQDQLRQYMSKIEKLCQELSSYGIAECLNHSDFHENNILYNLTEQSTAIIDLGETAICHPLFSLAACLGTAKIRYKLSDESNEYLLLQQTCYSDCFDSENVRQQVLKIIDTLLPIYLLFTEVRLQRATCPLELSKVPRANNRVYKFLAWFLENKQKQ